jgi:cytosine/adenosine deaminase-related metal-dependent hydrolase
LALRARLVFPVGAPPQRDGVVTIAGDRIVAVGENLSGKPAVDLGDVAMLPGLVNPHTHLEFSLLARPLGHRGMPLPDWITEVVLHRRAADDGTTETARAARRTAIVAGLRECLTHGVTTVGDIVTTNLEDVSWYQPPVRWYLFRELLGQTADAVAQQVNTARRHIQQVAAATGIRAALSPHAPYSAARELIAMACRLSREHLFPVALHLAESPEELQLLATGAGPLRDMLEQLGAWHPPASGGGCGPRDYLELLDTAHRGLVVHGNYLAAADWDFLAQRAERMAVVYCPRTHQYFGHPPYPVAAMTRRGVRVVVGTDSRASNPDLSLWEELRTVARTHPRVAPDRILRMGTLDAAAALGCDKEVGSLEPGKRADMALVRINHQLPTDEHAALWDAEHAIYATMCGGRFSDQRRQQ